MKHLLLASLIVLAPATASAQSLEEQCKAAQSPTAYKALGCDKLERPTQNTPAQSTTAAAPPAATEQQEETPAAPEAVDGLVLKVDEHQKVLENHARAIISLQDTRRDTSGCSANPNALAIAIGSYAAAAIPLVIAGGIKEEPGLVVAGLAGGLLPAGLAGEAARSCSPYLAVPAVGGVIGSIATTIMLLAQ